jgi:small subunit ribosomal protein S2
MKSLTIRDLMAAGVHFGHKSSNWNPLMKPYIYGERQKIHIIDLDQTLPLFNHALEFIGSLAASNRKVLFVGTKFAARDVVRTEAKRCGMPYVDYRWLGGMLTNYKTIRQSIKRLKDLEVLVEEEKFSLLTKKERLNLIREKDKLAASLDGIKDMNGLPDCLFIIDVNKEHIAIQEAKRLGIPVIGIVDTNSCPNDISYIVPGNDDALRAVNLYCKTVADLIIEVRGTPEQIAEKKRLEAEKAQVEARKKVVQKRAHTAKSAKDTEGDVVESGHEANVVAKDAVKKIVKKAQSTDTAEKNDDEVSE